MSIINYLFLIFSDAILLLLMVSSMVEKEKRASLISLAGLILNSLLWLVFIFYHQIGFIAAVNIAVAAGLILFGFVSLIPFFPGQEERNISAAEKYDERDNMFARNNLGVHPELARNYYAAHPEKKEIDKKIHDKPELGERGGVYYDHYGSAIFDAAFRYLARIRSAATGEKNRERKKVSKDEMTAVIKEIAALYGAVDVGITKLNPHHLYSHQGRHKEGWGEVIKNDHSTAVVFVLPMDSNMIKKAPGHPAAVETAHQYVEAAKVASIIAEYIRSFGYDAKAHIDANYEVLCVPAAVDAGIGELGRLGIFMHRVYGPCVRLSVVTTELELEHTPKNKKYRMEHFCRICKKCADNCPGKAIHREEEPSSRGFRHWAIDQEKCFSLWKSFGTDCALCIRSCPYSKPDTLVHKLVRFYISRNFINQRIALFFDDLLYGRMVKYKE